MTEQYPKTVVCRVLGVARSSLYHRPCLVRNEEMDPAMKEVCAQCLQKHVDPETGRETVVFSCLNQDQPMDHVDFKHLHTRLQQNTVQEKLSNLWLDYLLTGVQ